MAVILSYDDLINRIGGGFTLHQPWWGELQTTAANTTSSGTQFSGSRAGYTRNMPSLPANVSGYIPTRFTTQCNTNPRLVMALKLIDLGNLSLATPTFTDGVAMPTVTELGSSVQIASPILLETTTVHNSSPGNMTITYVDQNNNTAETTASMTLGASSPVGSIAWAILNSPDWGVLDVTSATRTGGSTPTGVVQFWGVVPVALAIIGSNATGGVDNLLGGSPRIVKLGAADVIGIFQFSVVSTSAYLGDLFFIGDS
jgi:hypothetical protein